MNKLADCLKANRITLFLISPLFFIIFLLYSGTFAWLLNLWETDRSSAHGFLVPLISFYLVWLKRDQLRSLSPSPAYLTGSAVTLTAAFMLVIGRVGAFMHAEAISLLFLVPGIILLVLGWRYVLAMGFPLFYLQFMTPWTEPILEKVHLPFQLITAKMASIFLELLGYSTFRTGIYVELPGFTMQVAPECSGITFLFSVIAIGLPLVYVSQKSWLRGLAVVGAGILTMFIANWIRVTVAGLMGIYYGVDQLHGPGHILRGWLVAQIGWVALFLANWQVGKIPCSSKYTIVNKWRDEKIPPKDNSRISTKISAPYFGVIIFLMGLTAYLNFFAMPEPQSLKQPLKTFPLQLGEWKGHESDWIDGSKYFPGFDSELKRTYTNTNGKEVSLYIAYFAVQSQEKALISFHNKPLHKNARQVKPGTGTNIPEIVNASSLVIDGVQHNIYFWYQLPEKRFTGRLETKFNVIFDALRHRRNNGAIIMLATRESDNNFSTDMNNLLPYLQAISEKFIGNIDTSF